LFEDAIFEAYLGLFIPKSLSLWSCLLIYSEREDLLIFFLLNEMNSLIAERSELLRGRLEKDSDSIICLYDLSKLSVRIIIAYLISSGRSTF
jgi:hypothetical protein